MRKILAVLAVTLTLGGCAQLREALTVATTTIVNPVDSVDIYRAKNVYAATLQIAVDWETLCWSKPYAQLMNDPITQPLCQKRRPIRRAIKDAKDKASMAVHDAVLFVEMNPTLNAATVVSAAWDAVNKFKNVIPAK